MALQYLYLISEYVFYGLSLTYQVIFALIDHDLCRAETGIVIARHGEAICSCIAECDDVSLLDLRDLAVPAKGICLADIAHDSVYPGFAFGVGYIDDMMIGIVQHGAYQVVEARV
jgi:hypothetical protein